MANVYFSDGNTVTDHNWNTVGNWYSTLAYVTSSTYIPGIPLGRLPNPSTDSVVIADAVTTGPSSTYTGTITFIVKYIGTVYVNAGHYTGNVTVPGDVSYFYIQGGTWDGNVTMNAAGTGSGQHTNSKISGGTFNGNITMNGVFGTSGANIDVYEANPYISGGTFNGTVTMKGGTIGGGTFNGLVILAQSTPRSHTDGVIHNQDGNGTTCNFFFGGTYSPTVTFTYTAQPRSVAVSAGIYDPGFAAGGGTYSPTYVYTNFPDILGAGLL
jgi:hypothetical protein